MLGTHSQQNLPIFSKELIIPNEIQIKPFEWLYSNECKQETTHESCGCWTCG